MRFFYKNLIKFYKDNFIFKEKKLEEKKYKTLILINFCKKPTNTYLRHLKKIDIVIYTNTLQVMDVIFVSKNKFFKCLKNLFFFYTDFMLKRISYRRMKIFCKISWYLHGIFFLFKKFTVCGFITGALKKFKCRTKAEIYLFKRRKLKKQEKTLKKHKIMRKFYFFSVINDNITRVGLYVPETQNIFNQWSEFLERDTFNNVFYKYKNFHGIYEVEEFCLKKQEQEKQEIFFKQKIYSAFNKKKNVKILKKNLKLNFKKFKRFKKNVRKKRKKKILKNEQQLEEENLWSLALALFRFYKKYGKEK